MVAKARSSGANSSWTLRACLRFSSRSLSSLDSFMEISKTNITTKRPSLIFGLIFFVRCQVLPIIWGQSHLPLGSLNIRLQSLYINSQKSIKIKRQLTSDSFNKLIKLSQTPEIGWVETNQSNIRKHLYLTSVLMPSVYYHEARNTDVCTKNTDNRKVVFRPLPEKTNILFFHFVFFLRSSVSYISIGTLFCFKNLFIYTFRPSPILISPTSLFQGCCCLYLAALLSA